MKTHSLTVCLFAFSVMFGSATAETPHEYRAIPFEADGLEIRCMGVLDDPVVSKGELAARLTPGEVGFVTLDLSQTNIDLSQADSLIFSWKVEGEGVEHILVKIRNYPLVGGMEAVYTAWDPRQGPVATQWRRTRLPLSEPDYDDWGGEPNKKNRYITFRAQTKPGSNITLYLKEVMVLPKTFKVQIHDVVFDGQKARVPVSVLNESASAETVMVQMMEGPTSEFALAPGEESRVELSVNLDSLNWASKAPLEAVFPSLTVKFKNRLETCQERTVKLVKPISLPERPRLLMTPKTCDEMKGKIEKFDWAKSYWEGLMKRADGLLAEELKVPNRGGNWYHWYTCPEHCAALRQGKKIGEWQWEHTCPIGKEVYLGDPSQPKTDYDACVLSNVHHHWSDAVRDLGLVYQYTGDAAYATRAKDILLAYAEKYPDYALHTIHGEAKVGGGKIGAQTLDEAVWTIPAAQGADMIWDTLSDSERTTLAKKLFLPIAHEVILPHILGIHNIQCWKNSAIGNIGFLLGDHDLIWEAVNNPDRGFRVQMEKGVLEDGLWFEGSWGYHFYTMNATWPLVETAGNCGLDLYSSPFKSLFQGPVRFAMPDGSLPSFNDSGNAHLRSGAGLYELAYSRYGDEDFWFPVSYGNRGNMYALLYGSEGDAEQEPVEWKSENLPQSGYGVLAQGTDKEATWLCLKYGPHGGGHGHPDKLNFVLYGNGQVLAIDPGSTRYGNPMQKEWYKTTVAHNTLVVNESNQAPAEGQCLAFGTENGVDYIMAEAGPIYEGVRFVRTALLLEKDLLLFADFVACETESTLDVFYHHEGTWILPDETEPIVFPSDKDGYRHLRHGVKIRDTAIRIDEESGASSVISFPDDESLERIAADGPRHHIEDRVPCLIMRKHGKQALFVWAVSLSGEPVDLEIGSREKTNTFVSAKRGLKKWFIEFDPETGTISVR